jgi:anti-sigma B factor antagonist
MDDFSISSERNARAIIVSVSGRVDSFTAATLDSELAKLLYENNRLIVDLKDVAYLSSAGVRAIVRALQSAQKSGGGVRLALIPAHVMQVLETVGMMDRLQIYPSVDEAIASFEFPSRT